MGSTGEARKDPYFWMRDMTDEVLEHLKEENAYTESQISREDVELLAKELKDRDPQDDDSVPYTYRGYTYHSRIKEGWEYPVLYRRKVGSGKFRSFLTRTRARWRPASRSGTCKETGSATSWIIWETG